MQLKEYALFISFVHLIVFVTIIFDIPILRQISLFFYLLFIPGFVFIGVLKLGKISLLDLVLFSVGLSIALDMFVGFFINEIYPIFGISQPLSTVPILLTMSFLTLFLFVLGFRRDIASILNSVSSENLAQFPLGKAVLLMFLPIISVISVVYLREAIAIIPIIIAIIFVVSALSFKLIPVKLYPLLVFAVSLSLAIQFPFMTKHIVGSDSPLEFYVYKLTAINGRWLPIHLGSWPESAFNSMLSITILPSIYSALMNMKGELIFKILYPIIFSFVPVIIYRTVTKEGWHLAALLSALFFVSTSAVFYGPDPLSVNRQLVGSFFLLLSIFLLVEKQFSTRNNQIVFIVFSAALVVSHYTLTIIYLSFLVLVYIFVKLKRKPESVLNVRTLLLSFGMASAWYFFTPGGVPETLLAKVTGIISSFSADFFNNGTRPTEIFATHQVRTIASSVNWILFIIANFLLIIGILTTVLNKQNTKLDFKYRIIILCCSLLLFLSAVVPNFSATLNFPRFYEITLLFGAPCFVIGGITIFWLFKKASSLINSSQKANTRRFSVVMLLIAIILSAYFLSSYGFINHFGGGSAQSYTLDWNRMITSSDPREATLFYYIYTPEHDISGATWLSNVITNSSIIYSDFISASIPLRIHGMIPESELLTLTNETTIEPNSFVYLRYFNVVDGFVTPSPTWEFNTTTLSSALDNGDCVYSNGGCLIYASPTT